MCQNSSHLLKSGLLISKAVVTVNSHKTVPIKLLNPTNDQIFISRGDIIASFEPFTEDYMLINADEKGKHFVQNVQLDKRSHTSGEETESKFLSNFELPKHLSTDEQRQISQFLIQYKDLFVTDENPRLGYTELVKHNICLKPDFKPKHQQPYRLSPDKKNVLRDHLDELLKQGIISPVQETEDIPITSPIVLVSKRTRPQSKNNSINKSTSLSQFRFCCDFRNRLLRKLKHYSPVLAFPKYDLPFYLAVDTSCKGIGYMLYQQHSTEDSSEELRVIRFGSKSLSKWQRSYGPTKLELLGMVTAILDCSMYLRGQKFVVECDHQALKPLFQKQLKGAIYERWIAILQQFNFELRYKPGKDMQVADALSRAPKKSSTTGFESPDQLDPYFPYHTENVGNIITPNGMPFTNLLCSDKSNDTDELQLNNIDILQNLFSRPVRESFKQTDFEYDGDTEENDDCVTRKITKKRVRTNQPISIVEKPVASDISDSTAKVSEKENSVQSSDGEIKFSQTSDENLLMNNSCETSPCNDQFTTNNVEESQSALSSTNIPESDSIMSATVDDSSDVKFISDEQTVQQKIESLQIFRNCDFSPKSLKQLQVNDPQFGNIFRYLENGDLPQSQKLARKVLLESGDFSLFDDLLFHTRIARSKRTEQFCQYQLALPEIAVKSIISLYHDSPLGGHGGIQHTVDLIREHYYFSNLAGKVSDFIKSCHACQCRKMTTRKTKAGIVAFQTPIRPFQVWEIDLFGPVPVSKSGNSYVCTAVDMFSKFIFTEPIPNSDPITVSHALYKIITQFGVFDTLISDHGSEMIGKCTKEICRLLDIKQQFTPSFTSLFGNLGTLTQNLSRANYTVFVEQYKLGGFYSKYRLFYEQLRE
ncbi:unnamed protein product [Mytilus coruscus]|uniref:Integrase catalytic domain-containing protein n=1 Tax=Mytilus coruscus TaxID=42192 RepID=A0A6J8CI22_MYTCO|nr:unnamed protein product [Mytilus coruscus]